MEPFTTQDKQLALALATAGCTFLPQADGGPATNTYTPGFLRDRKQLPKEGVCVEDFEETVKNCVERRFPGIVDYHFVRDSIFERSIKAWDEMVKEMTNAKNEGRAPFLPDISEAVTMQVLYLRRMNEKDFAKIPWFKHPECATATFEKSEEIISGRPAPRTKIKGGFKRWTLGCSDELRKELKL